MSKRTKFREIQFPDADLHQQAGNFRISARKLKLYKDGTFCNDIKNLKTGSHVRLQQSTEFKVHTGQHLKHRCCIG